MLSFNRIALRKAKIACNFGLSECSTVNSSVDPKTRDVYNTNCWDVKLKANIAVQNYNRGDYMHAHFDVFTLVLLQGFHNKNFCKRPEVSLRQSIF